MKKYGIARDIVRTIFCEDIRTFSREEKFKSNRVLYYDLHDYLIISKVQASMKDKSYGVSITLKEEGGIKSATCECPRGKWICSHMAAAMIYMQKIYA